MSHRSCLKIRAVSAGAAIAIAGIVVAQAQNRDTQTRTQPTVAPLASPLTQTTLALEQPRAAALPGGDTEAEYRITPQTLVEITVYGLPEMTRVVRVNGKGQFSMPLIGTVDALGLTGAELERRIASMLAESFLQNPQVNVFVKELPIQKFTIEGAVNRSGVFPLQGQVTLLRALAIAGGPAQMADVNQILLFRAGANGQRETSTYDIEKIRAGSAPDPLIQDDDLLVINRSKARTALKDSLFRDILDTLNPFTFLR
jgi:polysaccharide biosynthesis/export protein